MTSITISPTLVAELHRDLDRPHAFAAERVGFLVCESTMANGAWTITAQRYVAIPDDEYESNPRVGACVSSSAFRRLRAAAHMSPVSIFHVHRHDHHGTPGFSAVDVHENKRFIPDFVNVRPELPHGAIVFSLDSASAVFSGPGQTQLARAGVNLQKSHSQAELHHGQPTQSSKLPRGNVGSDHQENDRSSHWIVRWWFACVAAVSAYWRR